MSGQICMGCGLKTRRSYGRWPDQHPWATAAFAALVRVARSVDSNNRGPTAAMLLVVPATLIGLAVVAAYPLVFVPLLILLGVALVVLVSNEETRRNPACWRGDCPAMHSSR
ncbi:hypothetical protein A5686_06165 [Mycobacterium sp. E2479]|nr:hypothetical protein A5686_06165 [Mycobacterium sp. E2479]